MARRRRGAPALASGGARRRIHTKRIGNAKAVAFPALVAHVAGVEVTIHRRVQRHAIEVLHAVRHVRDEIPSVGIVQEVVDTIPLRDAPVVLQGIDVVVGRPNPLFCFQDAGSDKHQRGG